MTTGNRQARFGGRRRTAPGWMCLLYSGPLNIEELRPEDIDLRDIAGALALINRFAGQSRMAIPVLWHSRMVAAVCGNEPPEVRLEALLHDAGEAYVGDWIRPLKHRFSPELVAIKDRVQAVCLEAAGLDPARPRPAAIQAADDVTVRYEMGSRFGLGAEVWWEGTMTAEETARMEAARAAVGDPPQDPSAREAHITAFAHETAALLPPGAPLAASASALGGESNSA